MRWHVLGPSGASLVLGAFVARKAPLALCAFRRHGGGKPLLTQAKVIKTFEQHRSKIGAIYGMVMRTSFWVTQYGFRMVTEMSSADGFNPRENRAPLLMLKMRNQTSGDFFRHLS
jgi:hypothetical protein